MEFSFPHPKDEWDFEMFCLRLLKEYWPDSDPEFYGRRRQAQDGVDILDMTDKQPLRAAQCKHKSAGRVLTALELTNEVEKAKRFEPPIGRYYVMTTSAPDTKVQKTVLKLNRKHKKQGLFKIILMTWDRIEEILRGHPGLYDHITDPPLTRALQPLETRLDTYAQRLDLVVAATGEREYDATLDFARQRIEEHDLQGAKLTLRRLCTNRWSDLSERQRFLTKTLLAQVEYRAGRWCEAGKLFLEAKPHQPDDEKAQVNEALGHELIGECKKACALSRSLLARYPRSSRLWAVICRSADDDVETAQLEAEMPDNARHDEEVLVALSMRASKHKDVDAAVRFAKGAATESTDWAAPWLLLAQARLQQEIRRGFRSADGVLVTKNPAALPEVVRLYDRALALSEKGGNEYLTIRSLLGRGWSKRIAGDGPSAEEDLRAAYGKDPRNPDCATTYAQNLLETGDTGMAIKVLRESLATHTSSDAKCLLAVALRAKDSDRNRSEWLALACEAAEDPDALSRCDAIDLALRGLLEEDRVAEAERLLERLAASALPRIAVDAFAVRVELAKNNREGAAKRASAASCALSTETPIGHVRLVADAHCRLGDYGTALDLWRRVAEESRVASDVSKVLDSARRVGEYGVIRTTCAEWRAGGVFDLQFLNEELDVLEKFAPNEAVTVLQEAHTRHADDARLRLRLSLLAIQLDRPELDTSRAPDDLPPPDEANPRAGALVVRVLEARRQPDSALRYAYRLLKHNPDCSVSYLALVHAVMASRVPEELLAVEVGGPGAAVSFIEDGTTEEQWRVIEDDTSVPRFPDDLSPDHAFAAKLMGLRPGVRFLVAGHNVDGRYATVREVVSKYVYRARRCLSEWELRFPNEPGIEMFRFASGGGDIGARLPDITPMIRRTYEQKRSIEEMLKNYRETPATINLLAGALGRHFVDVMTYLAQSDNEGIRCCDSSPPVFEEAVRHAGSASEYVLDLSAIVTLMLLALDERLGDSPTPMVVSTSTVGQLRALREARRLDERSAGRLVPVDGHLGIRFVETTEEERRHERERIQRLVERILKAASMRDCPELASVNPKQREEMIAFCGQHGAESLLLARATGAVLWTDDAMVAAYGQQKHGIRRVWTQAVLARLVSEGFLPIDAYQEASARLIGYDYAATRFNADTLYSAARLASWNPSAWPLKQSVAALSGGEDPGANLVIAGLLIRRLASEPLAHPGHGQVVMSVLDRLADGPFGVHAVEGLHEKLLLLFGVDVSGARQTEQWLASWLSIRRSVQRA